MSREYKKRELLATQNKRDQLKKEAGIFERNKLKTIGFGALVTILGPMYTSEPDLHGKTRNALEVSQSSYLELSLGIAVFYSLAVVIAHFTWKRQEKKKLKALEEKIEIIKMELEVFDLD